MSSANPNILDKTFKFLGANANGAILVTCIVAGFKGVFRPMFTMMDKHSDPETKKYAAIREGLTEIVAIPVYIAIPLILGKIVDKAKAFKDLDKTGKKIVEGNAKFLGVCVSTVLIPIVCNYIQPPIMNAYKKRQEAKKALNKLDVTLDGNSANDLNSPVRAVAPQPSEKPEKPSFTALRAQAKMFSNANMKVGG